MLVLRRREGQWIEMKHHTGDTIRFRVYNIVGGPPGQINLAFDDVDRKFEIHRPERHRETGNRTAHAGQVASRPHLTVGRTFASKS